MAGGSVIDGTATAYGPSYNGQPLGCGSGLYSSADPSIAASPWHADGSRAYPCGAQLRLCGPGGCAVVVVQDACPGCPWDWVDLSEAANELVCGAPAHTCRATIERLR